MADSKNYTYQSIARAVTDQGLDTMFGLMGDANLFMVDHYVRGCSGNFVPVAYEGSAVLMAQAYARIAQKVGVATVTHGPALTNCVTALTEGARGNIPMVLLAGDTSVMAPQNLQNIDQREVVKTTGAGFEQMRSPETASYDVAHAFHRARVERRPIVLNMPADFMWAEVAHVKHAFPVFGAPSYVPEGDDLDEAVGMIASAKRPIILAGVGALDAREQIIALAERMEAPLATTLKAKSLFNGHPANMGIFGTLSTPAAYDVIAKADCVVAFGASLHHFTTDQGKLMKGKRVVQINDDLAAAARNYHPDAALIADAGLTADNILWWLDEAEIAPTGFSKELDMNELTTHPVGREGKTASGCINFVQALERLETALPENRLLTTDGGRFMTEVWCRISAPDARSFIATTNFGSIGLGLQVAIGAGIAAPDRPVVLFTGDGGFMMGGINEFNTAVRLKQDLIVIVCNDSAYGAEHIQFLDRSMDPGLSQFDWPSFAEVATALGGKGILVTSDDELEAALPEIDKRDRPLLIELRLDPHDVPRMRI
ncbi:thiamine pyrophosphate-binding protein [Lutimaribacter sp. EGI FJ00015]|uniref:Thiamine pyrophosphate-binding protein n=1 Tax=Lutimaribacter degradans TaxID=2945989 RepID=A0ACC5ZYB4_9RHOB|nr:thiamine pyrophosphate-binding protein [Lutimaribacter sp. EGI FJ00013]MCM2562908.1 thiamine pyrophosphate-binding protein [Lutimaribacter sp. EGI FJ00013]MCO0614075.1 thiamine pyrophosphate-binding protein [Lutimaribacter sp. EGI FJ00015]MCO0636053.1 thiamine pyrophosphate-binding protein [Lutimaribacter sp. EGI FJ00014]